MRDDTTGQSVLFPELFGKKLVAKFDQRQGSSDGGAILLKAADERLGLSAALAGSLRDRRQPGKIEHTVHELLSQRLYAIACGYEDCNDAARLASDPVHRLLARGEASAQALLASQSTLSRFENAADRASLYPMSVALAACVIERHRRRLGKRQVRHVRIDLDPTDDPTHGAQQLRFFNGHDDSWCYLPMAGFVTFNDEPDQYLFCYVLRPGNAPARAGAIGILSRIIERVREAFPKARILVRLDGGFAGPALLNFLDDSDVDYLVGMAENKVLARRARRRMGRARRLSRRRNKTANVFGETRYAARSWKKRTRRVLIKAEVVRAPGKSPTDNARFVVTNLRQSPRYLYKRVYCGRGDIENRIKELHHGLQIDRTSCTSFLANQLRVLITAAAYLLMQEVRLAAKGTSCERAQVSTLRDRLIKLGAWIETSVRRIVLHLPKNTPHRCEWQRIARSLGAVPA
ncbi:MAG: IS1380 family transposase [Steroidobacteraceae bacterium]|nr:IS1380 family transposase [Steroidobacteraceae bacterium]